MTSRSSLDLRLAVSAEEAFARLAEQAGLALRLVGRPDAFEIVATPLPAPFVDYEFVRCVLRGRFVDLARGSRARARLAVRPYWRGMGQAVVVTAWALGLNLVTDVAEARDRVARLRRQRRAMLKMWAAALVPVAAADADDPFRGLAAPEV